MGTIYFSDCSEWSEFEANQRGFRIDVYVKIHDDIYNLNIYSPVRLFQDFYSEIEEYGQYVVDPNLVLVKEVNRHEIIEIILKLYRCKYFEEIKPIENIDVTLLYEIKKFNEI